MTGLAALENAREHPARTAAMHSMQCVEQRNRDGWLALWDDDGIIEDPVGKSPLDPDGDGHRGIAAIARFYDRVIARADTRFEIRQTFAAGNECANVGTITTRSKDGSVARTELVAVYAVNAAGKLISLRAFWEFDDTRSRTF